MYTLSKNDHQKSTYKVLPTIFRHIYMFLITISALYLKCSLLKPVRHVMSGLLKMQTIFMMLFTNINSTLMT
jgi:hypothetical protein